MKWNEEYRPRFYMATTFCLAGYLTFSCTPRPCCRPCKECRCILFQRIRVIWYALNLELVFGLQSNVSEIPFWPFSESHQLEIAENRENLSPILKYLTGNRDYFHCESLRLRLFVTKKSHPENLTTWARLWRIAGTTAPPYFLGISEVKLPISARGVLYVRHQWMCQDPLVQWKLTSWMFWADGNKDKLVLLVFQLGNVSVINFAKWVVSRSCQVEAAFECLFADTGGCRTLSDTSCYKLRNVDQLIRAWGLAIQFQGAAVHIKKWTAVDRKFNFSSL